MKFTALFFLSLLFTISSFAQLQDTTQLDTSKLTIPKSVLETYEDTLGVLGYAIVHDSIATNRFAAVKKFIPTLVTALKEKNSFDYPFKQLKTVSITYPADSTFRIFTWQLFVDNDTYRYYGAIQMNSEDLILHPLRDRSDEIPVLDYEEMNIEKWYGSLYYKIVPFETSEGTKYVIFSLDYLNFFERRKIIDILSFDDEGKPIFGGESFVSETKPEKYNSRKRIVLDYSAEANVKANYDEQLEMIIFDHLRPAGLPAGPTFLPDGSYEGFKLQNGQWMHVEKVFDHVYDTAPREQPVLDQRQQIDIFGEKKKKKG